MEGEEERERDFIIINMIILFDLVFIIFIMINYLFYL